MSRNSLRVLSKAIAAGDIDVLADYLKQGGDPNACDRTGCTLLHDAAHSCQPEIVRALIEAGAEVDSLDRDRCTPLDLASSRPYRGPMTLVTPSGLCSYSGFLKPPSSSANVRVVTYLLDAGAVVDRDKGRREIWSSRSPLAAACDSGAVGLVGLLLARGADVSTRDDFDSTPLIAAVNGGHLEVVEQLLQAGANPNTADRRGQTPLIRSIYSSGQGAKEAYWSIAVRLIDVGADPNRATIDDRETPLFAAINECRDDFLAMILEAGGRVNHRDRNGNTALCFLVKRLHGRQLNEESMMLLAQVLLAAGASREQPDQEGRTPMDLARHYGFKKLIKLLAQ